MPARAVRCAATSAEAATTTATTAAAAAQPVCQIGDEHPGAVDRYLRGSRPQHDGQHDAQHCTDQTGDGGFDGGDPGDNLWGCANESQGREAFPALGSTQAGDNADQKQNGEEHRNGPDGQHRAVGGRAATIRVGGEF